MWTDGVSTKLSILVECDSIPTDKHEIPTPATTAAKSTVERTGWTVCERMCVGGQGGPVQVQTHSTAIFMVRLMKAYTVMKARMISRYSGNQNYLPEKWYLI